MPPTESQTIDYGPLQGMQHAFSTVFKRSFKDWKGLLAFGVLLLAAPVCGVLIASGFLVVFGPVLYFVFLAARTSTYRNKLWYNFAAANGWSLDTTTSVMELVPPSMQFGHSQHFSPIIQAQLGDLNADLFSY